MSTKVSGPIIVLFNWIVAVYNLYALISVNLKYRFFSCENPRIDSTNRDEIVKRGLFIGGIVLAVLNLIFAIGIISATVRRWKLPRLGILFTTFMVFSISYCIVYAREYKNLYDDCNEHKEGEEENRKIVDIIQYINIALIALYIIMGVLIRRAAKALKNE